MANQGESNYIVPQAVNPSYYHPQQDVGQQQQYLPQQMPFQQQQQPYVYAPQVQAPPPQVYAQPVPQPLYAQGNGVNLQHGPDGRCCGCKNTCCNPYLHLMMLLMMTISLISCFVSLTGEMHYITLEQLSVKTTISFFRDHETSAGISKSYNNLASDLPTADCANAGSALLNLMIFSILTILFSLVSTTLRMFNKGPAFFRRHTILMEMVGIALSLLLFGIANAMWAVHCFKKTADWANQTKYSEYTLVATGYSYLDASTILIFASLIHILVIRNNPFFRNYGRVDPATLIGHMQQPPPLNEAGYVPVPDYY